VLQKGLANASAAGTFWERKIGFVTKEAGQSTANQATVNYSRLFLKNFWGGKRLTPLPLQYEMPCKHHTNGTLPEILLAKIFRLRYIALTLLIRYVGSRVALAT
jgi:hypothetical protein